MRTAIHKSKTINMSKIHKSAVVSCTFTIYLYIYNSHDLYLRF